MTETSTRSTQIRFSLGTESFSPSSQLPPHPFSSNEYSNVFPFPDESPLTLLPPCSDPSTVTNTLEHSSFSLPPPAPLAPPSQQQKIFLSDRITLVSPSCSAVDTSIDSTDSSDSYELEEENPQTSSQQDTDSFITYDPNVSDATRRVAVSKERYEYLLHLEMNLESILHKGLEEYIKNA